MKEWIDGGPQGRGGLLLCKPSLLQEHINFTLILLARGTAGSIFFDS